MTPVPISEIPVKELLDDLLETEKDISLCQFALQIGETEYNDNSVEDRLEGNWKIRATIQKELMRRSVEV